MNRIYVPFLTICMLLVQGRVAKSSDEPRDISPATLAAEVTAAIGHGQRIDLDKLKNLQDELRTLELTKVSHESRLAVLWFRCRCSLQLKDRSDVEECYGEMCRIAPSDRRTEVLKVAIAVSSHNWEEARTVADAVSPEAKKMGYWMYTRGIVSEVLGDHEGSFSMYEQALQQKADPYSPSNVNVLVRQLAVCGAAGWDERREQIVRQIYRIAPDCYAIQKDVCKLAVQNHNRDEGLRAARILSDDTLGSSPSGLSAAARVYLHFGEVEEAVTTLLRIHEVDPKDTDGRFKAALILHSQHRSEEGNRILRALLQTDRKQEAQLELYIDECLNRSVTVSRLEDIQHALKGYAPDCEEALLLHGLIRYRHGDPAIAIKELRRLSGKGSAFNHMRAEAFAKAIENRIRQE